MRRRFLKLLFFTGSVIKEQISEGLSGNFHTSFDDFLSHPKDLSVFASIMLPITYKLSVVAIKISITTHVLVI